MSRSEPNIARRGVLKAGAVLALSACAPGLVPPPRTSAAATGLDPFFADDATALAHHIRQRELTPVELLDIVIHRIEALNGDLNAVTTRTFERARLRAAGPLSDAPFAGVPYLIKDMIDCAGIPRSDGAHEIFGRTPTRSPEYMEAVEAAGFNIVGVTNVPEFATLVTTINPRFGATLNPWDVKRTPAGSSGGSASAVAAGLVPMAHATDGAGSIRLPASYCGVFGFKPSRGRTVSGEMDGGHDIVKHHHAISRSVRDSATLLYHTEDVGPAARYADVGWVVEPNSARRTIALDPGGLAGLEPDAETRMAFDHTAGLLSDMGHHVLELAPSPIDPDKPLAAFGARFHFEDAGLGRLDRAIDWQGVRRIRRALAFYEESRSVVPCAGTERTRSCGGLFRPSRRRADRVSRGDRCDLVAGSADRSAAGRCVQPGFELAG